MQGSTVRNQAAKDAVMLETESEFVLSVNVAIECLENSWELREDKLLAAMRSTYQP